MVAIKGIPPSRRTRALELDLDEILVANVNSFSLEQLAQFFEGFTRTSRTMIVKAPATPIESTPEYVVHNRLIELLKTVS